MAFRYTFDAPRIAAQARLEESIAGDQHRLQGHGIARDAIPDWRWERSLDLGPRRADQNGRRFVCPSESSIDGCPLQQLRSQHPDEFVSSAVSTDQLDLDCRDERVLATFLLECRDTLAARCHHRDRIASGEYSGDRQRAVERVDFTPSESASASTAFKTCANFRFEIFEECLAALRQRCRQTNMKGTGLYWISFSKMQIMS